MHLLCVHWFVCTSIHPALVHYINHVIKFITLNHINIYNYIYISFNFNHGSCFMLGKDCAPTAMSRYWKRPATQLEKNRLIQDIIIIIIIILIIIIIIISSPPSTTWPNQPLAHHPDVSPLILRQVFQLLGVGTWTQPMERLLNKKLWIHEEEAVVYLPMIHDDCWIFDGKWRFLVYIYNIYVYQSHGSTMDFFLFGYVWIYLPPRIC